VGYKIYYGVESGKYTKSVRVTGKDTRGVEVENLEDGKIYFFAVTSYDAKGIESAYSVEISNGPEQKPGKKQIGRSHNPPRPGPASNVSAQRGAAGNTAADPEKSRRKITPSRHPPKTPEGKILPSK
jgi:hypothetical protein